MIKRLLLGFALVATLAAAPSPPVQASPLTIPSSQVAAGCGYGLLTLPTWYRGLTVGDGCVPQITGIQSFWIIGLNIVEMLMHIAGYTAAIFVLWGGMRYILAAGEPDKISSAKQTIQNAIIGLIISVVAIAGINFVVNAALG